LERPRGREGSEPGGLVGAGRKNWIGRGLQRYFALRPNCLSWGCERTSVTSEGGAVLRKRSPHTRRPPPVSGTDYQTRQRAFRVGEASLWTSMRSSAAQLLSTGASPGWSRMIGGIDLRRRAVFRPPPWSSETGSSRQLGCRAPPFEHVRRARTRGAGLPRVDRLILAAAPSPIPAPAARQFRFWLKSQSGCVKKTVPGDSRARLPRLFAGGCPP